MTARVLQFDPAAHKVADVLLPWFVNGTLDGDELAFVQQHLGECARCQREVEWLRELHAACVACAAAPNASNAFGKLRRQLEEPSRGQGIVALLRSHWRRARPWSQWVIAAQLAVIVALGALLLPGDEGAAPYRTLAARNATAPTTGTVVVVFDPTTTESDFRRILRRADARVVDGPTQTNAYILDVPLERRKLAVQTLRAERAVVLVEQLGAEDTR
jgi:hypothetical protein